MSLVSTRELLDHAVAQGTAVPALNVIHLESAEAIAAAAEQAGHGAVLQISQNCVKYHGALAPIAAAARAVAQTSSAPLSLHLDHAEDLELVHQALDLGFSSVMYDGAALPYARNVATTAEVVRAAAAVGVLVEAELGEVGGKDGAHAPGVRTDPDEAGRFVAETGVDALAVAVGSSHAMTTKTASIDTGLVAALAEAVPVPLVLHGSSGVPDADITAAIGAGMRKINVSTQLVRAFTGAVRERLDADPALVDSRAYVGAGRTAMTTEAAAVIELIAVRT
ncbi:class II fructose-bisphosphate aldolase [Pseudactinotalea sp. Z1748]|uniref:class II fructose-bisphosphate aldolase n=1 Tax=Pseudactinotalea sp. Z1748 TaxID=3413027 RepID=UPI003C7D344A